jgi:pimeloyl-ACP methyl ester carboxylesterase
MDLIEFNAHRRSVRTASGEIGYADFGAGRPALFVHGLGTNGYLWRNVIAQLAADRRCVAIDLPGHGGSPADPTRELSLGALADAVEDFCDALGLTAVDLVANDSGGAVSQIFASRHPERLATFTLTNCEAHDNIPNEAFRGTVELARRGELVGFGAQLLGNPELARSERALGANYEDPAYLTDEAIRTYLEPVAGSPDGALQFQRILASLDPADLLGAEPGLRRLTVPTLIVWGTGDLHFEVTWAHYLRGLIPGARPVVELAGAKLHFPDERAGEFAAVLREHWALHSPAPVDA